MPDDATIELISNQQQHSSALAQNNNGNDRRRTMMLRDVIIDVNSDQPQHSSALPQNNNGNDRSLTSTYTQENIPITVLLEMVAKMLGVLVCGWVVLVLVQGGMVASVETKDRGFVTMLFFLVCFRCWRHYCPQAPGSLTEATQSLSANNSSIPNNNLQFALPICYIRRLFYCSKLVSVMTSVVLSVMRLASQDFGKKEMANKESRDFALKVFYGLTLAEALLLLFAEALSFPTEALVLLFAEALSFPIRGNSGGLADGQGDGLEVGLITRGNSVGLADGPGDVPEDGLITRGNSVGLEDGPGDGPEDGPEGSPEDGPETGPVNQSNECNGVAQMDRPANQINDFKSEGPADSLPKLRKRQNILRPPPDQTNKAQYCLVFLNKVKGRIYTNELVRVENGDPIKVAIWDTFTRSIISTDGSLSSARVILTVFDAKVWENKGETWSWSEFNQSVFKGRKGKGPILTGPHLTIQLKNGIGTFENIICNYKSSGSKGRSIRLGVMVEGEGEQGYLNGKRVQEGVSKSFRVLDRRLKEALSFPIRRVSVGLPDGPGDGPEDGPVNQSNKCNGVAQMDRPANQSSNFKSEGPADSLPKLQQRILEIPQGKKRKALPEWRSQVTGGVEGPLDDGHSWRKYGQKDILGAKHSRGYYRCTHCHLQGCQATKQVQRTDDNPTIFDVIYHGTHTCINKFKTHSGSNISCTTNNNNNRKTRPKWRCQVKVGSTGGVEGSFDDGHRWKKYGQKDILGAKHPRGYYRCTHRHSQGCQATKQVQRTDDNPTIFDVIYHGTHTCINKSNTRSGSNISCTTNNNNNRKTRPKWRCQVKVGSTGGVEGSFDGHRWKKYGQKDILGAKHPKGYYRCTHRHSQGCQATKQVQRTDDNPTVFDVIYLGIHTCIDSDLTEVVSALSATTSTTNSLMDDVDPDGLDFYTHFQIDTSSFSLEFFRAITQIQGC